MVADMPSLPGTGAGRSDGESKDQTIRLVGVGLTAMVLVAVVLGVVVIRATPTRTDISLAARTSVRAEPAAGAIVAGRPATIAVEVVGPATPRSVVLLVDGGAVAESPGSSGAVTYTPELGTHQAKVRVHLPDGSVADSSEVPVTASAPPTTPPPAPSISVVTPGTCGATCFRVTERDVRFRPVPGTDDGGYPTLVPGSTLTVACQVIGPVPPGRVAGVWNRLTSGGYVYDGFVDTPKDDAGQFTKGLARC
jgi:hypothetical protein